MAAGLAEEIGLTGRLALGPGSSRPSTCPSPGSVAGGVAGIACLLHSGPALPLRMTRQVLTVPRTLTGRGRQRAGPALVPTSQITSRRLVSAIPAATRATAYPIRMTPPTHPGGAYGNAGPDVIMTSEATAGAMTGAARIQSWWNRL
jgi:hypothetical protein